MLHSIVWESFIDTLYPVLCNGCGKPLAKKEQFVCLTCEFSFPLTNYVHWRENPVERLLKGRFPFYQAASYMIFSKNGLAQRLLHNIKYNGNKELGYFLGQKFGTQMMGTAFASGLELVVPTPIHKRKMLERGFNQSEWIAKGIADALSVPLANHAVQRITYAVSQTLSAKEKRLENVKNAFQVFDNQLLENKKVLLVDDTITTGATLESLAQCLVKSKIEQLSICTLASIV
jgi:ComF family protein